MENPARHQPGERQFTMDLQAKNPPRVRILVRLESGGREVQRRKIQSASVPPDSRMGILGRECVAARGCERHALDSAVPNLQGRGGSRGMKCPANPSRRRCAAKKATELERQSGMEADSGESASIPPDSPTSKALYLHTPIRVGRYTGIADHRSGEGLRMPRRLGT